MNLKFYVRTTKDRILDNSYNQIDYQLLVDREHKPIDSFINALYTINDEDAVLMEDDLILCQNFQEEIEKVINANPNRIINFFQMRLKTTPPCDYDKIVFNQCTFYPKGIAKQIADIMIEVPRTDNERKKNMYSLLENVAFERLNIKVLQYAPHLVQHLDNDTLLFNKTHNDRRSIYFLDYLKELNVGYETVINNVEIKRQLFRIMKNHFRQLNRDKIKRDC